MDTFLPFYAFRPYSVYLKSFVSALRFWPVLSPVRRKDYRRVHWNISEDVRLHVVAPVLPVTQELNSAAYFRAAHECM
jgi:hypothetical protein